MSGKHETMVYEFSVGDKIRYIRSKELWHVRGIADDHVVLRKWSKVSSIEKKMTEVLVNIGLVIETQVKFGRYNIDITIPNYHIAIECDGKYWHNLPENMARDQRKNEYIRNKGWSLIRLPEEEINNNIDKCLSLILATIDNRQ